MISLCTCLQSSPGDIHIDRNGTQCSPQIFADLHDLFTLIMLSTSHDKSRNPHSVDLWHGLFIELKDCLYVRILLKK